MPIINRGSSLRPNGFDPLKHKTHKSTATIELLKKLTLEERLKANLEIEKRNGLKRQAKLKKVRGEDADDMSDTASLIGLSTGTPADYPDPDPRVYLTSKLKSVSGG
ncbi:hypothetical protein D9758_018713 [Tetrapyrgos nigripes]|uniref:Uncharacterized protein n=1 Tax=Tetrapyrgos nigripes TaxID=182062 RepID=A0A8H5EV78_9AGAR|nr:hypothetical protein D9758_018713 [Tetrapyrgos nigripes]